MHMILRALLMSFPTSPCCQNSLEQLIKMCRNNETQPEQKPALLTSSFSHFNIQV